MSDQTPSIGRIVHYKLNAMDAKIVNERRAANSTRHGNEARAGDVYPMIIIRVWGSDPTAAVNGQVLLDGNDTEWLTSRCGGEGEGQWTWPERI